MARWSSCEISWARRSDVPGAQNYVREALQAVAAGLPVKTRVTRAYGCTVKYA